MTRDNAHDCRYASLYQRSGNIAATAMPFESPRLCRGNCGKASGHCYSGSSLQSVVVRTSKCRLQLTKFPFQPRETIALKVWTRSCAKSAKAASKLAL
jgi:hypothetical protein